jgi:hypothetical protein
VKALKPVIPAAGAEKALRLPAIDLTKQNRAAAASVFPQFDSEQNAYGRDVGTGARLNRAVGAAREQAQQSHTDTDIATPPGSGARVGSVGDAAPRNP